MSAASVALSPIPNPIDIPSECLPSHLGQNGKESILIFLAVSGSVVPLRVLESESVASVKLRIRRHKGFFVTNHKLVFDGRELARNDSPVLDYGVTDGTLLHLAIRLSDLQAITVRSVSGKEYEFHIDRSRNVGYLKKQIAESGKDIFSVKDQALVCDGEELEDQRLIHEYCRNSSDDSVIHLLVRKSAKVRAKPVGKEFEVLVEAAVSSSIVDGNVVENKTEIKLTVDPVINGSLGLVEKKFFKDFFLKPLIANPRIQNPLVIRKLVESTYSGLYSGKQPIRSSEASGGVYFMQDSSGQEFVSIFKPVDEEPMAVNNPKGLPCSKDGEGLKKGSSVGEGALREVAAYILDHPKNGHRKLLLPTGEEEEGYAGVPPTTMVKCLHKGFYHPNGYQIGSRKNIKIGSLQTYVKNIGSCEEMGPGAFPVEEVHKICVLDIRLANTDRHFGNILVSRDDQGTFKLIPIDHGYCLPKQFEDCTFDWLYWPQARQPFSAETLNYIKSLDAEHDIKLLKLHGWDVPPECRLILQISTMLLKKGANRGLTPFTIGSIMCRETLKKESLIEQIVKEAKREASPSDDDDDGDDDTGFLEVVSIIMDQKLDQIS